MRTLVFCLLAIVISVEAYSAPLPDPSDSLLDKQVLAILRECGELSHGWTRKDLLEHFTNEGGMSTFTNRTYVSRVCPYIKVDVVFKLTTPGQTDELPTDRIKSVSRAYLDYAVID
jgi:hypothetical protein